MYLYLYYVMEKYSQSDYKTVSNEIFDDILPNLPIVRCMYVALFATTFSMAWYKIIMQPSLVEEHGISHFSFVFSLYTLWLMFRIARKYKDGTRVTLIDITMESNRNIAISVGPN